MKALLPVLFFATAIACNEPTTTTKKETNEILLYFVKDKKITLRPGQITEAEFWNPEILDSIKLTDTNENYIGKFYSLKDTALYAHNEVDLFSHFFAFVFKNEHKLDTIYANETLKLFEWKGRNKFYKDTSSFFRNRFASVTH